MDAVSQFMINEKVLFVNILETNEFYSLPGPVNLKYLIKIMQLEKSFSSNEPPDLLTHAVQK